MAKDLNLISIEGNLGRDATANDKSIFFTMASTESYKDKQGEYQDVTTWAPVVYYRSTSEKLVAALTKGTKVRVTGKLSSYQKEENGQNRSVIQIKADNIDFLPTFRKQDGDGAAAPRKASASAKPAAPNYDDFEDDGDKPW